MGTGSVVAAFVGAFVLVGLITVLTSLAGHGMPYGGPIPVGTSGSQLTLPSSDAYRSSFSWTAFGADIALTAAVLLLVARSVARSASGAAVATIAGGAIGLVLLFTALGSFPRTSDVISAVLPATALPGLTIWLYAIVVGSVVAFIRRRRQAAR